MSIVDFVLCYCRRRRGCWLLPTSDEAAVVAGCLRSRRVVIRGCVDSCQVAQQQSLLRSLGWRVVSAPVEAQDAHS